MSMCIMVSSRAAAHQTQVADLAQQAKAAGLSSQVRFVLFPFHFLLNVGF